MRWEYCFVLARPHQWVLRPRWCLLASGAWQFQWLCFYLHRVPGG